MSETTSTTPANEVAAEAPAATPETEAPQENLLQDIISSPNLDFLLDVPLVIAVELGRRSIPVAELLNLGKGSVLELDKVAGEPLDLRINGRLIARGEAVVVNDKFGVRLTQIVSPGERVSPQA